MITPPANIPSELGDCKVGKPRNNHRFAFCIENTRHIPQPTTLSWPSFNSWCYDRPVSRPVDGYKAFEKIVLLQANSTQSSNWLAVCIEADTFLSYSFNNTKRFILMCIASEGYVMWWITGSQTKEWHHRGKVPRESKLPFCDHLTFFTEDWRLSCSLRLGECERFDTTASNCLKQRWTKQNVTATNRIKQSNNSQMQMQATWRAYSQRDGPCQFISLVRALRFGTNHRSFEFSGACT